MRYGVFVALGLALGLSCSLAEELEGAACRDEADCDKSQTCVKTLHQLSTGFGTCTSDSACRIGNQAGCACDGQTCGSGLSSILHPEREDGNGAPLCFCCPSSLCAANQDAVIGGIGPDGTAQCRCCDRCEYDEMPVIEMDDDGSIVECGCVPKEESMGSSSSGE